MLTMDNENDIKRLIETEVQHNLWSAEIRGVRVWSLVRYTVLSRFIARWLQYDFPTGGSSRRRSIRKLSEYARGLSLLSPFKSTDRHDALFFVTDLGRLPRDAEHSYNYLHDVYFRLFQNPLIIESNFTPQAALPHYQFESNIYPYAMLSLFMRVRPAALSAPEARAVRDFVEQVVKIYDFAALQDDLAAVITRALTRQNNLRRFFERILLPRVKSARFAFREDASYMGESGLLTRLLHEYGFLVAEPQHGLLSAFHPAYHLPSSVLSNLEHPARAYLPDIFLTYGEYWSQQAHVPAAKFVIGSAQLAAMLAGAEKRIPIENQILVISGDNRALALGKALAEALPAHQIVFKLHPLEFAKQEQFQMELNYLNVRVVARTNVYELIAESPVIVGHSSTVLVEAVAFAGKRVFYYEPAFIPAEVGTRFWDAENLVDLILDPSCGHPQAQPSDFWELDVEARAAAFARTYLRAP